MPRSIEEVVLQVKRIELVVPWDIPNTNALFVCNQLLTRSRCRCTLNQSIRRRSSAWRSAPTFTHQPMG
ncbi:unnamed protein product [Durusdinium trenchii]|uniref:Uncharacterized protein n=1 Tax=Durusdinium trenchii TaxID=1381693 RepID=A0ABP0LRN7_9DINO